MLRLIIVDDESMTRKLLENVLDWNELGIEIVGLFSDGQSALNFIKNNKIDIVLSDIKMSPMTGLELAKHLHENFSDIYIVIMSAYRDFEYARESIKYSVYDYILKPITYDGFYEVFSKMSQTIRQNANSKVTTSEPNISLSLILSYVRSFLSAVNSCAPEQVQKKTVALYDKFGTDAATLSKLADCLCSELCSIYGQKIIYASADGIKNLNKATDIAELKEIVDELVVLASELHSSSDSGKQNLPAIELALQYIEEHCHEQITRNDVAEHIALSPQYFSRYFHSQTNETFSNYLKQIRIRKAKYLLKNTNLKIKEISSMVGIKKERYFSTLFKQLTDLSPQEYRTTSKNTDSESLDTP